MSSATQVHGQIDIRPVLNDEEQAYLAAFTMSPRVRGPGSDYDVPGNPAAAAARLTQHAPPADRGSSAAEAAGDGSAEPEVATGQPSLWCPWTVCWEGCCLTLDPRRPVDHAGAWARYLIDHFLRPGAVAGTLGIRELRAFSFDHRVDGVVLVHLDSSAEPTARLIVVTNNAVYDEVVSGDRSILADDDLWDEDADIL